MTAADVIVGALLALGVGIELLCCLGVLLRRSAIDRLHYSGAGASLGPILIAAAIVADESVSAAGLTAILVAALLFALNAVLTIATARLARGLEP